jgi:hypothetical protein
MAQNPALMEKAAQQDQQVGFSWVLVHVACLGLHRRAPRHPLQLSLDTVVCAVCIVFRRQVSVTAVCLQCGLSVETRSSLDTRMSCREPKAHTIHTMHYSVQDSAVILS